MEDATFEVVDLDDADLRGDTAEHMFEVLDFEEDGYEDELIAHDDITAEVEIRRPRRRVGGRARGRSH